MREMTQPTSQEAGGVSPLADEPHGRSSTHKGRGRSEELEVRV